MAPSSGESDEEDFMSDAFLVEAEKAATPSTSSYSERRRKQLNAAHDAGKTISRAERERIARQQGLGRNLIGGDVVKKRKSDDASRDERADGKKQKQPEGSTALRMMLAMGFTPGAALGKRVDGESVVPSNDPIALDERRLGGARRRAGIGRLPPASAMAMHADIARESDKHALLSGAGHDVDLDAASADFRVRAREQHEARHAESLLSGARKTCQELDVSQLDMTYSPLWLNPEALHKRAEELPQHVAQLVEYAFAGLDVAAPEAADKGKDEKAVGDEDRTADDDTAKDIASEKDDETATTMAADLARTDEARRFCSLPAIARLQITLSHLRRAHHYCLHCGHRYDSAEDLDAHCPGEDEEDH